MKNFKLLFAFSAIVLIAVSCQDNLLESDIEPINNNEPTTATIASVSGMDSYAKGVYNHTIGTTTDPNASIFFWFVYGYHETMGDVMTMPWGNFGGRWVNQTESITLDDGTVITPPAGGPQPGEIEVRNTRAAGSDNMTQYEWFDMYALNGQCNTILANIDNLIDATQTEKDSYKAWALWWKALAYHKIGSLYEQGLIINELGEINNEFVSQDQLIVESNRLLNELSTLLGSISDTSVFDGVFEKLQINIVTSGLVNFNSLKENINTLKARNMVYNTKVTDMSAADWTAIVSLTSEGISSNTNAFTMQSENTVLDNSWLPGQVTGFWYFPSPRLIQDINDGDERLDSYFFEDPFPNPRGRGIQYGATHFWNDDSPIVSTSANTVSMFYAGSHEENLLLLAEAKIRTGDIEGGLNDLDTVRMLQNSGLAPTVNSGLTETQALEEVRKERRLALLFRAVSFYDARRYGIASGSRMGAHVLDASGNLNTNATINYGYKEYWPVPAFESDFNPIPGSQN